MFLFLNNVPELCRFYDRHLVPLRFGFCCTMLGVVAVVEFVIEFLEADVRLQRGFTVLDVFMIELAVHAAIEDLHLLQIQGGEIFRERICGSQTSHIITGSFSACRESRLTSEPSRRKRANASFQRTIRPAGLDHAAHPLCEATHSLASRSVMPRHWVA